MPPTSFYHVIGLLFAPYSDLHRYAPSHQRSPPWQISNQPSNDQTGRAILTRQKNAVTREDTVAQSRNRTNMASDESGSTVENKNLPGTIFAAEPAPCTPKVTAETSGVSFHWSKSNLRDLLSVLFVVLFSFFWLAKINGCFDFTGQYNIKYLHVSRCPQDALFMLDNELKTNWSNKGPNNDDYLIVSFRYPQIINKVEIVSSSSPKLRLVSWDINSHKDKNIKYHCQHDEESNTYVYVLEEEAAIQNIRIEVDDIETRVPWTIEELRFDIKKNKI